MTEKKQAQKPQNATISVRLRLRSTGQCVVEMARSHVLALTLFPIFVRRTNVKSKSETTHSQFVNSHWHVDSWRQSMPLEYARNDLALPPELVQTWNRGNGLIIGSIRCRSRNIKTPGNALGFWAKHYVDLCTSYKLQSPVQILYLPVKHERMWLRTRCNSSCCFSFNSKRLSSNFSPPCFPKSYSYG